jgi:phosphinothricin acetyltransferase
MSATIRPATGSDAAGILDIYAPIVRATVISFEFAPPDLTEMQQRIEDTLVRFPWLVCVDEGQILGYAYAGQHRTREAYQWSVDVSVYVHAQARRSGVGTSLYTSLFQVLTLQGFYNAYAGITLPNPASVGLHESLGFQLIGVYRSAGYKFGAWHDTGWWQRALRAHRVSPDPPAEFRTVRSTPECASAVVAGVSSLQRRPP